MIIETNNNENNWKLWHYRLGHLSTKNMKILESEDVNVGVRPIFNTIQIKIS